MKVKKTEARDPYLQLETTDGNIFLSALTDSIVHVVYTKKDAPTEASPLNITAEPTRVLTASEEEGGVTIRAGRIVLNVNKSDTAFSWWLKDGRFLLREGDRELTETPYLVYSTGEEEPIIRRVKTVDGERNFVENLKAATDHTAYHAKLNFEWQDDETIHGLGQGEEGIYDYRGQVQYLYQHNMRIPVPFLISNMGYGILFDTGSLLTFNDDARGSYVYIDTAEELNYYLIAGDTVDEIIHGFRTLTGHAAMLPKWAFGYVQSRERYKTQQELLDTAAEYRKRCLGLDCIVQDWKTWVGDNWGCKMEVDKDRYPDLPAMRKDMEKMHAHTMVSVWPNMNFDTPDCQEMTKAGHLLNDLATYDAFSDEAREIYWKQCSKELFKGFDSWWCDSTEPFSGPDWGGDMQRQPWERFELVGNEHKKFLNPERANLYALYHARGIFENQRKEREDMRVLNLTRSGYPGIQKYGTMLWSGDTSARWDVLRKQLTEGLNMSLSGMPYWTLDIGGFFTVHENIAHRGCDCENDPNMKWFWHGDYENGVDDPGYRELYTRWFQMGAFLPMFRSHGTDTPREVWQFGEKGEPVYDALADAIAMRYRLMPYIYSLAGDAALRDGTIQRSLLFDFADDPTAAELDDEYMFGPSLLVVPVTEPMYYDKDGNQLDVEKTWECYLPELEEGDSWTEIHTGIRYGSGQFVTVPAAIDHIPVFAKAGAVIPMEVHLEYADQKVDAPLEIHVVSGADGSFDYYEDAGNDYGYEKGEYSFISMDWNDTDKVLIIGKTDHTFEGGIVGRELDLYVDGVKKAQAKYDGSELLLRI